MDKDFLYGAYRVGCRSLLFLNIYNSTHCHVRGRGAGGGVTRCSVHMHPSNKLLIKSIFTLLYNTKCIMLHLCFIQNKRMPVITCFENMHSQFIHGNVACGLDVFKLFKICVTLELVDAHARSRWVTKKLLTPNGKQHYSSDPPSGRKFQEPRMTSYLPWRKVSLRIS